MKNTIIYIIGYPASGKYTAAKHICAAHSGFKLIDNHLINNPVFNVIPIDGKTKLPDIIWDQTDKIRNVVLETIQILSPPEFSFVFTNCLYDNVDGDRDTYIEIKELSEKRGALFIPVVLQCDAGQAKLRIISPDRKERMKDINPDSVDHYRKNHPILRIEHPNLLTLNNTDLTAEQTADKILKHANSAR